MSEKKYTPHVHAEVIKAWADGKPIQCRHDPFSEWRDYDVPRWNPDYQYRVKPEELVDYTIVTSVGTVGSTFASNMSDLFQQGVYFSHKCNFQGYLKRTVSDGKVLAMEFIPK